MYDFTLHLRAHDHTTWFWRYVGTAFGHFLLGSHSYMVTTLGSCVKWALVFMSTTLWPCSNSCVVFILVQWAKRTRARTHTPKKKNIVVIFGETRRWWAMITRNPKRVFYMQHFECGTLAATDMVSNGINQSKRGYFFQKDQTKIIYVQEVTRIVHQHQIR
jgi:hypothetical protein